MKKMIAFCALCLLLGGCKSMDWIYWFTPPPPPPRVIVTPPPPHHPHHPPHPGPRPH